MQIKTEGNSQISAQACPLAPQHRGGVGGKPGVKQKGLLGPRMFSDCRRQGWEDPPPQHQAGKHRGPAPPLPQHQKPRRLKSRKKNQIKIKGCLVKRNPPECKLGPPASAGGLILTSPIAPFHRLQLWGGFAGLSHLHAAIPNPVGGEEIGSSVSFMLLPVKPSPEAGRELCNRRKETRGEKQKRLQGGQSAPEMEATLRFG